MKIAITLWGTQAYAEMIYPCYESIEDNFLPDVDKTYFIFTDADLEDLPDNVKHIRIPHYGFPDTFNMTFEELSKIEYLVKDYDWLLSIDVDMKVYSIIEYDEFFDDSKKFIGVHHPCHFLNMPPHNQPPGSFDVNSSSNANVSDILDMKIYWQGCLWGGKIPYVFDMMRQFDVWIKDDLSNNTHAKFYEESYLNKWFLMHKEDTHTLSSSFAFPQMFEQYCNFDKKIIHLHKDNKSLGNNSW